ncbi:receptor-like protein EIX2 [Senna tora]|uniref:Receptor-like protein EIX2 n=1 Tax=Senna tora TaxID=362788 RepID=A0A834WJN2_9FABA|nr:receptor-like protein EIX2 [Senna tora]
MLLLNLNTTVVEAQVASNNTTRPNENHFDSEIFKWVSNLSDSLSALILENNQLKGQIPCDLRNLRNLEYLELSFNELNGTIPDWFGQYKYLQYLEVYGNSLEGFFPASIGNLSSLVSLELSYNHLNGSVPKSLGKLSKLEILLLGGNSLVSVASKMNFTKLTNLQMSYPSRVVSSYSFAILKLVSKSFGGRDTRRDSRNDSFGVFGSLNQPNFWSNSGRHVYRIFSQSLEPVIQQFHWQNPHRDSTSEF